MFISRSAQAVVVISFLSVAGKVHAQAPLDEGIAGSWAFMMAVRMGKVEVVGGVRDAESTTLELMMTEAADGRRLSVPRNL